MTTPGKGTVIIAGLGPGLGLALATRLTLAGYPVAGFTRSDQHHAYFINSLKTDHFRMQVCDVTCPDQVAASVTEVERDLGPVAVYIHNAAMIHMQPFSETGPDTFESQWRTACLGAVIGTQRVLPGMLESHAGTLLYIGATASVKAAANFSAFGSAKFALRGLAQSLARELGPQGVHVAHLLIDGVMWGERARDRYGMTRSQCIEPAAVADTCLYLIEQDRSAWTHELDIRPDIERF